MIKAGEISEIIKRQLAGYEAEVDLQEVGRVIEVGDGIARIYGLDRAMSGELLAFPGDVVGMVLNLEQDNVGAVLLGDDTLIKEGDIVKRTNRIAQVPVGEARGGPRGQRARPAGGRQRPDPVHRVPPHRALRAGRGRPPLRQGAAPDRPEGHRLDDPHRARTARADHRRPRHRQDRGRRGHDHQPEGRGRLLLLRRRRPEAVHGGPGRQGAGGLRRHGLHDGGDRLGLGAGAAPVHRPLRGRHHGRVLPRLGPPRALHLRRPVQARHGLPPALAPAPAAAGPRGVSGRRLLPALAAPGAGGQAQRRAGGRVAHRAAHHRDPARRRGRLHPDQRHLDHRRPDLPRGGPLLRRRAARP